MLFRSPRPQVSRITPQSCSQATGIQNQTSVMLPGHRVLPSHLSHIPESNRFHVHRKEGNTIKTDIMFPGHSIPQSNISHVPRPMVSRIKPQSCCQATGFQNQTVLMFPGHRVSESTDVMFPGHRIPEPRLSHFPKIGRAHV